MQTNELKEASDANINDNIYWIGKRRERAIYYRPDGTPTLPLPADPYNQTIYLKKGFSLKPKARDDVVVSGIKCPYCEFEPKNALGLRTHLNTHVGKIEKKEED